MHVVDTNVVVRLLAADDRNQHERARQFFEEADQVLVLDTVLLETAWVLLSAYNMPKDEVLKALTAFLDLPNVRTEHPGRSRQALSLVESGMDVADAFHIAAMPAASWFVTFDERLYRSAARADVVVRLL